MELITLNTPHVVDPRSASTFTVDSILLNWKDKMIVIHVGNGSIQKAVTYTDTVANNNQASTLMIALNKANLTSNSLHKRIINQLITDGHLAGTISGNPD